LWKKLKRFKKILKKKNRRKNICNYLEIIQAKQAETGLLSACHTNVILKGEKFIIILNYLKLIFK
ncbi:MAG: hypothetical protein K2O42_04200, partial [Oscillospiraceae bacterium]|nr:hypothetical protein [Oscillospiraceae bacterium]